MSTQLAKLLILILFLQLNLASDLKIITKKQWKGIPANGTLNFLQLPVANVIIAHTATQFCTSLENCSLITRFIQTFHMESRNFADIAYNFLIGGNGLIFEGRGWNVTGAHTKGYNNVSINIAFIGAFNYRSPSKAQLNATKMLLAKGVEENKLSPNYKLFGQRQLIPTDSPGHKIYKIIKTWPHWSNVM